MRLRFIWFLFLFTFLYIPPSRFQLRRFEWPPRSLTGSFSLMSSRLQDKLVFDSRIEIEKNPPRHVHYVLNEIFTSSKQPATNSLCSIAFIYESVSLFHSFRDYSNPVYCTRIRFWNVNFDKLNTLAVLHFNFFETRKYKWNTS